MLRVTCCRERNRSSRVCLFRCHGTPSYSPELSAKIELTKEMGWAFVSIGKWSVDLSRSVQIRLSTGTERQVRRTTCSLPSSPDILAFWEWEVNRGCFVPYGIQASVDIEQAYLSGCRSVDLYTTASRLPYLVDMAKQIQTRHGYGTKRRVRGSNSLNHYRSCCVSHQSQQDRSPLLQWRTQQMNQPLPTLSDNIFSLKGS